MGEFSAWLWPGQVQATGHCFHPLLSGLPRLPQQMPWARLSSWESEIACTWPAKHSPSSVPFSCAFRVKDGSVLASWVTFSPSRLLIHHPLGLRQSEESVSWRMEDSRFWSLTREVPRLKYYLSTKRCPGQMEIEYPLAVPSSCHHSLVAAF